MLSETIFILAAAAAPAASDAQPATQTVQQAFDAASTLYNAKDYVGALAAYKALEARIAASGKNKTSLALVRLRRGVSHASLNQFDDAITLLRRGLSELPTDNANLAADRLDAQLQLAQMLEYQLDHTGAADIYRTLASQKLEKFDVVRAQSGIARTLMFTDGAASLAAAEAALAVVPPDDKDTIASLLTLRGRVLMNLKRFPEAHADLKKAMTMLGGLTRKVDFRDLQARSDLAIVSMLMNKKDEAREYLAYTGAGRFDAPLISAAGDPPTCGGTPNIAPEDVAIVNFTIDSNGTVGSANTVYASNPATALSFAEAVRSWSWTPENLAKIPALFRATTRIELRCTRSIGSFGTSKLLEPATDAWAQKNGLIPFTAPAESYAGWINDARRDLVARRARHGPDSMQLIPVLTAIMSNPLSTSAETTDAALALQGIANKNALPPAVRAMIVFVQTSRGLRATTLAGVARERATALQSALAEPTIANDAVAAPALLLEMAETLRTNKDDPAARQMLQRIVDFPGLAANDPAKVAALVRIASIEARAGDLEAAQQAFLKTGLSESQCALVDAKPVLTGGGGSDADFPREALQWGFSGFAVSEYDIDAAGKSQGVRTTIAYPPLVFGPASNKITSRLRFTQSFRPNGTQGCTARSQRVNFRNGF
jgi:hypothetical protein